MNNCGRLQGSTTCWPSRTWQDLMHLYQLPQHTLDLVR
jgi:hypothetical protein